MTRGVFILMLILGLAGCATGSARRDPPPGGADANAEFARELRQAEKETFEGQVDAKLKEEGSKAEVSASGEMDGVERGTAEGAMAGQRANLGWAFYTYAGIGVLLLLYLIYLLMHRQRDDRVRIRY